MLLYSKSLVRNIGIRSPFILLWGQNKRGFHRKWKRSNTNILEQIRSKNLVKAKDTRPLPIKWNDYCTNFFAFFLLLFSEMYKFCSAIPPCRLYLAINFDKRQILLLFGLFFSSVVRYTLESTRIFRFNRITPSTYCSLHPYRPLIHPLIDALPCPPYAFPHSISFFGRRACLWHMVANLWRNLIYTRLLRQKVACTRKALWLKL